jgi:hypothetical protein
VTGACSLACATGYLQCIGGTRTCTSGKWSFEDGTADGFALLPQTGDASDGISVSTAQHTDGTHALAIPVTFNCTRRSFEVALYPCMLGTPVSLVGKTLTFQVYMDGPAFLSGPVQPAASVIGGSGTSVAITPAIATWINVSLPFTDPADASADGFDFSFYMLPSGPPPGNVCMTWTGTIYLDAFAVQ